jgi:hypothetical protein
MGNAPTLRSEALYGFGGPTMVEPRMVWCHACRQLALGVVCRHNSMVAACGWCGQVVGVEQSATTAIRGMLRARERQVRPRA